MIARLIKFTVLGGLVFTVVFINRAMPNKSWDLNAVVTPPAPNAPAKLSVVSQNSLSLPAIQLSESVVLLVAETSQGVDALAQVKRLQAQGFRAYYDKRIGTETYQIWVGPYRDATEAQADMRSLAALSLSSRLLPYFVSQPEQLGTDKP